MGFFNNLLKNDDKPKQSFSHFVIYQDPKKFFSIRLPTIFAPDDFFEDEDWKILYPDDEKISFLSPHAVQLTISVQSNISISIEEIFEEQNKLSQTQIITVEQKTERISLSNNPAIKYSILLSEVYPTLKKHFMYTFWIKQGRYLFTLKFDLWDNKYSNMYIDSIQKISESFKITLPPLQSAKILESGQKTELNKILSKVEINIPSQSSGDTRIHSDKPLTIQVKEYLGFIEYDDGTIVDPILNVMWQKDDDGIQRTYPEASDYCKDLKNGGYGDWRLPTKEELMRLGKIKYDDLRQIFPNIQKERYWAFTTINEVNGSGDVSDKIAYTVAFDPTKGDYGQEVTYFKTYDYYVRAIRKNIQAKKISGIISSDSNKQPDMKKISIDDRSDLVAELGTDPEKWIAKGLILFNDDKYNEAVEYFQKAMTLNPSHLKAKELLKKARQFRDKK
jgi:uncharacterized protein YqiB (DUF1249 family)